MLSPPILLTLGIDIGLGTCYNSRMKKLGKRRENPYYQSYLMFEQSDFVHGETQRLNNAGRLFLTDGKLRTLKMKPGDEVSVGLTRQGLILAMSPEVINDKIASIMKSEFLTKHDRDLLCLLYEDFGKWTQKRTISATQTLGIPAEIRNMLNVRPNDNVKTFINNERLIIGR